MKLFQKILAHATLIVSLMMLMLFMFDRFNRAMMFLSNEQTKWLLAVFAVLVAVQSVILIAQKHGKS